MFRKIPVRRAPVNYFDLPGSIERDKKIKQTEVFGKDMKPKKDDKKKNKTTPKPKGKKQTKPKTKKTYSKKKY